MSQAIIQLSDEPLGEGKERICYRHPDHAGRVIKLQKSDVNKQTMREVRLYRSLAARGFQEFTHIPACYGQVDTNLGPGYVFDRVADYDGEVSKSLWCFFQDGYPVSEFEPYLAELYEFLRANRIVFSVDMGRYNVLFQKLSPSRARLVIIDGLGNHTALNWPDNIPVLARRKIDRRWQRFITRLRKYSATAIANSGIAPMQLDEAYRRPQPVS